MEGVFPQKKKKKKKGKEKEKEKRKSIIWKACEEYWRRSKKKKKKKKKNEKKKCNNDTTELLLPIVIPCDFLSIALFNKNYLKKKKKYWNTLCNVVVSVYSPS